jgi:hypothetical protein
MSKRSPTKSAADEEYGRFLSSSFAIDPETGEAINPRESKGSTKLQATQNLHKMGYRLKYGHSLHFDIVCGMNTQPKSQ